MESEVPTVPSGDGITARQRATVHLEAAQRLMLAHLADDPAARVTLHVAMADVWARLARQERGGEGVATPERSESVREAHSASETQDGPAARVPTLRVGDKLVDRERDLWFVVDHDAQGGPLLVLGPEQEDMYRRGVIAPGGAETLDHVEHAFGPLTPGADTAPKPVERVRTYEHQGVTYVAGMVYRDVRGAFWAIVGETLDGTPLLTPMREGNRHVDFNGSRAVVTLGHLLIGMEGGPLSATGKYITLGH